MTFIPLAVAVGAEIMPGTSVTGIKTDGAGCVTAVVSMRNGAEERQPCRALFLCAGAVETLRLMLLNRLGRGPVGRHFVAHTGVQLWGTFDEEVRPYEGLLGGLISEDTHRPADADLAGGYLLQSIAVMPVTYASQVARGRGLWGRALLDHMRGFNHVAEIDILGQCLPHPDNRVELSGKPDARGLPKPRVHFSTGGNERRMKAHAERTMRAIWAAAGVRDMWTFPRYAHTVDTCRMGLSEDDAMVDADGRAFGHPSLVVCDNSVFPLALFLRTTDRFLGTSSA